MITNNRINFFIVVLSWVIVLFSINTGFYSITNLINGPDTLQSFFINFVNSLRWILPIVILPYMLMLIFKKKTFDLFSFSLIFISFYYVIHILLFKRQYTSIEIHGPQLIDNFNLLSCYIVTILIFVYITKNFKEKIYLLSGIFLGFLSLISIYLFYEIVLDVLKSDHFILYYNQALQPGTTYFDQPAPRVTGWSRTILLIFMIYFFYNELKQIKKKYYILNLLILLILSCLIILSQTRGALVGFVFMFILYIIIPKINIPKKTFITVLFFIIPFGLIFVIENFSLSKDEGLNRYRVTLNQLINSEKLDKSKYESTELTEITDTKEINIVNDKTTKTSISTFSVSSGRLDIWKKSLENVMNEKKIFGFGPQGDRYILTIVAENHNEASWSNNSSNAIVYSIVSGGLIGLILILLIYLSLLILFIKTLGKIFFEKKVNYRLISFFSIFCYIIMRSFFENGFAVFGIDFCSLVVSYYVIKSELFFSNND